MTGESDQGVYRLKQAMGGGKTHNLLAAALLARDPTLRKSVLSKLGVAADKRTIRVCAFSGRETDMQDYLWVRIFRDLGREAHWTRTTEVPGPSTWAKVIGEEPALILLDELPPYFVSLGSQQGGAQARLRKTIDLLEAAGDNDPKLGLVLKHLRSEGWADRGCILFSQYLDTVLWIAGHLATAFADRRVGVYGGQGNCFLWENGRRRGAERDEVQELVREGRLRLLVATDAASEGLNLQRLSTLINIDLPWNPARLEQRKGRIDRIGQLASTIEVLNLRYRGSVEDDVHRALSGRLQAIRDVFGTVPDTLEDVWVLSALGKAEDAKRRIEEVPAQHPFELRYANDVPASAWERCTQVLDKQDVTRALKQGW